MIEVSFAYVQSVNFSQLLRKGGRKTEKMLADGERSGKTFKFEYNLIDKKQVAANSEYRSNLPIKVAEN